MQWTVAWTDCVKSWSSLTASGCQTTDTTCTCTIQQGREGLKHEDIGLPGAQNEERTRTTLTPAGQQNTPATWPCRRCRPRTTKRHQAALPQNRSDAYSGQGSLILSRSASMYCCLHSSLATSSTHGGQAPDTRHVHSYVQHATHTLHASLALADFLSLSQTHAAGPRPEAQSFQLHASSPIAK